MPYSTQFLNWKQAALLGSWFPSNSFLILFIYNEIYIIG